jgi:hypothetical protein
VNISTKSEYGLRALIYRAGNNDRQAISARITLVSVPDQTILADLCTQADRRSA